VRPWTHTLRRPSQAWSLYTPTVGARSQLGNAAVPTYVVASETRVGFRMRRGAEERRFQKSAGLALRKEASTMELETLEKFLDRCIRITERQWATAMLLGEARRRSNSDRAKASDRGAAGNRAVDLHGALGECLLYNIARRCRDWDAMAYMQK